MLSLSAQWYDVIYQSKDYRKESDVITRLLKKEHPKAKSLLDAACGTGEHDRYLSKTYNVDGLDINADFISIASQKNSQCRYFIGDMMNFSLNKSYDIIICLFSSIGYVRSLENVAQTLRCFSKHLNPDGIIIVEPWFTPGAWKLDGRVHMRTGESAEGKICRMAVAEQQDSLSVEIIHYLIGTKQGISHFSERHELGLFTVEEMKNAFSEAGLITQFDDYGLTGRGLYTAKSK